MWFDKQSDDWYSRQALSKPQQEELLKEGPYSNGVPCLEKDVVVGEKVVILHTNGGLEYYTIVGKDVFVAGRQEGGKREFHGKEFEIDSVNDNIYEIGWKRVNEFPEWVVPID